MICNCQQTNQKNQLKDTIEVDEPEGMINTLFFMVPSICTFSSTPN